MHPPCWTGPGLPGPFFRNFLMEGKFLPIDSLILVSVRTLLNYEKVANALFSALSYCFDNRQV